MAQKGQYDDIIACSRPRGSKHMPMSMHDRAAQFSPFAALTGFDAAIAETARLTQERTELSESAIAEIDETMRRIGKTPAAMVSVTYFCADTRKGGGAYVRYTGTVKKIDPVMQMIFFSDGFSLPFSVITDISADEREERS